MLVSLKRSLQKILVRFDQLNVSYYANVLVVEPLHVLDNISLQHSRANNDSSACLIYAYSIRYRISSVKSTPLSECVRVK